MPIQEVPWFQACVEATCLQCETLLDTPSVKLSRKARLNSARDGWAIVEFECPECHWKPPAITTCLDASTPLKASTIVAPTEEEISEVTRPQRAPRREKIIEPARPPVDVEELYAYADKKFPPRMKLKSGETLTRTITKGQNQDAAFIKVLYTDGRGQFIESEDPNNPIKPINPFHVERTLFCEPDLPDNQEFVDGVLARIGANLKSQNPSPHRVVAKPRLNAARSRIKCGCTYPIDDFGTECGDTSGGCGHPGILKNLGSPGGMRANVDISRDPDGKPITTLQEKLTGLPPGM